MMQVKKLLCAVLALIMTVGLIPVVPASASDAADEQAYVVRVIPGYETSFAVKSDGSLWAWGTGFGNLPELFMQDAGLNVQVSSGRGYSLVAKDDGSLWGWGYDSTVPVKIPDIENPKMFFAEYWTSIILNGNGTIWTFSAHDSSLKQEMTDVESFSGNVALKTDGILSAKCRSTQ